jgi:uncharacterized OB-fold protein
MSEEKSKNTDELKIPKLEHSVCSSCGHTFVGSGDYCPDCKKDSNVTGPGCTLLVGILILGIILR